MGLLTAAFVPIDWLCPGDLCAWAIVGAALPFSVIKLILLAGWVYAGVYLVQVVESGTLVGPRYKGLVKVVTLAAGPVVIPVIMMIDAFGKSSQSGRGVMEILIEQIDAVLGSFARRGQSDDDEDDDRVNLFDSSGRSIDEIYGHDKSRDTRILDLTEQIIAEALESRASDILIDPRDKTSFTIRFRIDGVLRTVRDQKADTCKAVVNSFKAVAGMDIAERRRPQDGAFAARRGDKMSSFRIASAGVLNGEKLSIRVLNSGAGTFELKSVGITKKQYAIIKKAVARPSGMICLCGPTGSGKTTTLYAMLNSIDRYTRNVITVEDPIEATLPESSQIEINPRADITFARTLRSVLRQDPDVICIGEIRDEETAEIALRAAQTGHLVLTTVHCDGGSSALVRLLDLGVSPLLVSAGLNLIVSQRLVRCLCEQCRRQADLSESLRADFTRKGIDCNGVFEPVGCRRCDNTGYLGRTAICDTLEVTDKLRSDILDSAKLIAQLRSTGDKADKTHLRREGLKRVAAGITSIEEVKRVIG